MIRATFKTDFPFCVTTPSGEPIKAYRAYKQAFWALQNMKEIV